MATKDGRAQIWYADGSGNVTGYTESVDDIAGTIIDAYNEHFGTGIEIWTPETKSLQVGGTVPNWNAYEKIEMPKPINVKICVDMSPDDRLYAYGYIIGGTLNLIALTENPAGAAQVRENGIVSGIVINKTLEQIMQMVVTYTVTQVKLEGTINYGSTVQSWEDYELVN